MVFAMLFMTREHLGSYPCPTPICQGEQRLRILEFLAGYPFLVARITPIEKDEPQTTAREARNPQLKNLIAETLDLLPQAPSELLSAFQQIRATGVLADLVASFMDLGIEEKQEILETLEIQPQVALPVGGIKEKVLAAGIGRVLLPARNRKELEEIPAEAREQREFVWLEQVDDALRAALGQ